MTSTNITSLNNVISNFQRLGPFFDAVDVIILNGSSSSLKTLHSAFHPKPPFFPIIAKTSRWFLIAASGNRIEVKMAIMGHSKQYPSPNFFHLLRFLLRILLHFVQKPWSTRNSAKGNLLLPAQKFFRLLRFLLHFVQKPWSTRNSAEGKVLLPAQNLGRR